MVVHCCRGIWKSPPMLLKLAVSEVNDNNDSVWMCIVVLVVGSSTNACSNTLLSQKVNGFGKGTHCRSGTRTFLPMLLHLAVTESQQPQ